MELNKRRSFFHKIAGLVGLFTFGLLTNSKGNSEKHNKFLTRDGKLVTIDKSKTRIMNSISNQELREWIK